MAIEKEKIKKKIDSDIRKTEESIRELREYTKPVEPGNYIGRLSRMEAINNKTVAEASLREAEDKMIKLKRVKENINNADFGYCRKCKKQIPEGRLMVRPHSTLCIACAR